MNTRTLANISLLAVIAVLAIFLVLTGEEQPPAAPPTVSTIDKDSIETITVIRSGQADMRFARTAGIWEVLAPQPAPANITRINAMLAVLQARSYVQLPAAGLDLERFDLSDPAVTLVLNDHKLHFGGRNPLEGRRYLLHGDTLHLISDGLFQQLQQPPEFFMQTEREEGPSGDG